MMGKGIGKFMIRYFNIFGKMVVKKAMADKHKLTRKIHKQYYKALSKPSERKGCYVFPREIVHSGKWLDSLWQQRQKINTLSTTFIWGMKDIAFKQKELDFWLSNWKNAEVVKLENAGHYPQEEATETVINILQK
jgi:haloalkane dehalogenase